MALVPEDKMCSACFGSGKLSAIEQCETCRGTGRVFEAYRVASDGPNIQNIEKADAVDHPSHYGGADNPYEVIKVLENWLTREEFIGALKFNIVKYTARARHKDGQEAHEKAAWYNAYLVDFLKRVPA